jgi:hypothetical protein
MFDWCAGWFQIWTWTSKIRIHNFCVAIPPNALDKIDSFLRPQINRGVWPAIGRLLSRPRLRNGVLRCPRQEDCSRQDCRM